MSKTISLMLKHLLFLLIVCFLARHSLPQSQKIDTQSAMNVELIGHIGGACGSICIKGNYALVDEGYTLHIFDITNPLHPQNMSQVIFQHNIEDIYVAGQYAYVAAGYSGLRIIDVSNPSSPFEAGYFDTPDSVRRVYVSGTYAYFLEGNSDLYIINISTPASPVEVGKYTFSGTTRNLFISGNYAYVAAGAGGLRIINVTYPAYPYEIGYCDTPGTAMNVFISGSHAYVADDNMGLRIIDVSNPSSPVEVGYYSGASDVSGVYVSGSYAYLSDKETGLHIIDISNPASPVKVGSSDSEFPDCNVYVSGLYAYVAVGAGFRIIDISEPASPVEVFYYDTPAPENVFVSENRAYVIDANHLGIIDISDPASPLPLGYYKSMKYCEELYVSGSYAYIADYYTGLRIIDVSNPAVPTEVGLYQKSEIMDVFVSGSYAYVAAHYSGLRVVDVSNPALPVEIGYYDTMGSTEGVYVYGKYAFLADGTIDLRIVDISNPTSPTEIGYYDSPNYASDVVVAENYAFLLDIFSGLHIIDISNPSSPFEVGSYDPPDNALELYVSGRYAYIAADNEGLRIIDISNPAAPIEVGYYTTPISAWGVCVFGNYACVADDYGGLFILHNTLLPLSVPVHYTFDNDPQGWQGMGEITPYDVPEFSFDAGQLGISANGSYNSFSYWYSPDLSVDDGSLYRARWNIGCTTMESDSAVQFRLRVNQKGSWQAWDRVVSSNKGQAPMSGSSKWYNLFFDPDVISSEDTVIVLNFDIMSFDWTDDSASWLYLEEMKVEEVVTTNPVEACHYSFDADAEGWQFQGAVPPFAVPLASSAAGYLGLSPDGSPDAFSFWYSPDTTIADNTLYRARFEMSGSATDPDDAVQLRCRVNQKGSWQAWDRVVNSNNAQGPSNTGSKTYDVIFDPNVTDTADNAAVFSFDILSFDLNDDLNSWLYLESLSLDEIDIVP